MQLGISGKNQFSDTQKEIADYNNDGKIDVQDVTKAQMIISEVTVPVKPNPTPNPDPEPDPEPEPEPEPTTSYNREFADRVTELVNIDLKIGEYNNAMTGMLYQFPEAGKKTYGGGFYFHLDREPDKEGKSHFQNGALLQNLCEYNYHSWEPGFAAIKLQSSIDDPWGELPIRTVIGGAYSSNDLMVHKLNLCEEIDADVLAPYLLTARYDRTAFMETGRR